ncbi:hypothetical protein LARI1_G004588 [Lachnellula arida]|uniref:Uncharacterized protein n=1 Tax=Lachnellula arida TaxID=1316785 RepID=A0A8T9B840_9HELO|nr:hypothetical protein LARI1_G004588 [Lachnellula arida]
MAAATCTKKSPKSTSTESKIVDPIGTPTYPTNGLWTVLTTTTICAPVSTVLEASLDISTWPKWNTFVPRVEIVSSPPASTSASTKLEAGTVARFHNKLKDNDPTLSASDHSMISIDKIEKGARGQERDGWSIVWKTIGIPGGEWVLRGERVQELVELRSESGTVETEYRTWGTFGGPAAYLLQWNGTRDDIAARFEDWANDLKNYVEG